MARDLNKVMIIGRLGVDPEMRYTPSGSPVTTFRVAVGRQWRDGNGETHDETEWFSVVAWNKLAEICNQYLAKGARVYIEGRLQTRSWEDQQSGQTRYKTEVIANDMIILDGREGRPGREVGDDFAPPSRDTPRTPRSGPQPPPPDIGDEDIPF
jgi:single-strand DNA-binding protein